MLGVFLTFLVFASPVLADESEPDVLSVSAERPHAKFIQEQIHFQIENNRDRQKRKAILVVNANFLNIPQERVRLGHYECDDLRKLEGQRLTLINWQQGLGAGERPSDTEKYSPDETRAFVGGFRLGPASALRSDALTFLENVWEMANWRPVDIVEIRKKAGAKRVVLQYRGKTNFREIKTIDELKCKPDLDKALACFIPKYGTAYLLK